MAEMITLVSADGAEIAACESRPAGACIGGVVILQEIFGLNAHIRQVCDSYAAAGWQAVAPALFHRQAPAAELAYDQAGIKQGLALKEAAADTALADTAAAVARLDSGLPKAVIGYCWGGSLAFRAACAPLDIAAAVCYYGGELPALRDSQPRLPVMAHFGRRDASIPADSVTAFAAAQPAAVIHIYDADHGFNCDHRAQYHKDSAILAGQRTHAFLRACF